MTSANGTLCPNDFFFPAQLWHTRTITVYGVEGSKTEWGEGSPGPHRWRMRLRKSSFHHRSVNRVRPLSRQGASPDMVDCTTKRLVVQPASTSPQCRCWAAAAVPDHCFSNPPFEGQVLQLNLFDHSRAGPALLILVSGMTSKLLSPRRWSIDDRSRASFEEYGTEIRAPV